MILRNCRGTGGFGLVELVVAVAILSIVVLGVGGVLPQMLRQSNQAHISFLALNAAEDRLNLIRLDPRFPVPAAEYGEVEAPVPDLPRFERTTTIEQNGSLVRVTVSVVGPGMARPVSRSAVIGEP